MLIDNNNNQEISSGKFFKKLCIVPAGLSLEDYVNELEERKSAKEMFGVAMDYPLKKIEERFAQLNLEGREVVNYKLFSKWTGYKRNY